MHQIIIAKVSIPVSTVHSIASVSEFRITPISISIIGHGKKYIPHALKQ